MSESEHVTAVRCDECEYEFPDPQQAATPERQRDPCPKCGATIGRHVFVAASDAMQAREYVRTKGKRPGEKKPYIEIQAGEQLSVAKGRFIEKYQRIDRDRDEYEKSVTDPATGEVMRSVSEPLTSHRGYGTAKFKHTDEPSGEGDDAAT